MLDLLYRVGHILRRRTEDGVVSLVFTGRARTEVA